MRKNRNFSSACKRAFELIGNQGLSAGAAAKILEAEGYHSARGGKKWWGNNTKSAAMRHAMELAKKSGKSDTDPQAPRGGGKSVTPKTAPAKTPKTAPQPQSTPQSSVAEQPISKASPAPETAPGAPGGPAAPGPRRPLKRMVSADTWETMPDGMRRAVVAEFLKRLG